ncbi:uncharacterized protein [Diadema antillarum]|uniref:uncharacterized protein n=1 Tax=Diadema antillarum TaxID=105358 RepID=UPI003A8487F4
MDRDRFIEQGKEFGLSGMELKEYVDTCVREARDERAAARAAEAALKQSETDLIAKQIQLEELRKEIGTSSSATRVTHRPSVPPLPVFQDGKDDIDAYLCRFERHATSVGWEQSDWGIAISALLTGKALSIVSRLTASESMQYEAVKKALLKGYDLTEEGYRLKFRNAKIHHGETYSQFADRIEKYLDRWVELSPYSDDAVGLKNLFLQEQTLETCSKDLLVFLRERGPQKLPELLCLAEQYREAHADPRLRRMKEKRPNGAQPSDSSSPKGDAPVKGKAPSEGNAAPGKVCFSCGKAGHLSRDCRARRVRSGKAASLEDSPRGDPPKEAGGESPSTRKGSSSTHHDQGAMCIVVHRSPVVERNLTKDGSEVKLACGGTLPVLSAVACGTSEGRMPVCKGRVNGKRVDVLRDTGCSTVVVRQGLVKDEQLTSEERTCVLIDGTVKSFQVARVELDTPYFRGQVEALCMTRPVYDVILGNIPGVKEPTNPDQSWTPPELQAQAVETRGQKERARRTQPPLIVPKPVEDVVSVNNLTKAQADDTSLAPVKQVFRRAERAGVLDIACTSVVDDSTDESEDEGEDRVNSRPNSELLYVPPLTPSETVRDVQIGPELDDNQRNDVEFLLQEYKEVMTDMPGQTNLGKHDIRLVDKEPIKSKPYPLPHALRDKVREEVQKMIDLNIIEPSSSPYASPVVMVKKKDGAIRFCCDYRKLNQVTIADAEPIPDQEEIFAKLSRDKYFTKMDLTKGYWQVPLAEEAKPLTAFVTHDGLYQFRAMPFGLVNAPASFSRIMRDLLRGLQSVDNFIDDILIHTSTWEEHLVVLREVLHRLREANLTAKPTKCVIGVKNVEFLGHHVGQGELKPVPAKVESIQAAARPKTKKQLRSFLGLVGYYRRFVPNFAAISAPLTDRTRKGEPALVKWGEAEEIAFNTLKQKLASEPILHLPDLERPFILRTDASDVGLGAILLQDRDGEKFPIAYGSRKLLPREQKYSVMERECLAVVWGTQKFEPYLYGKHFRLETDHQPLQCIAKSKVANGRILRWALALQPFNFSITAIKGSENVGADYLSRLPDS